LRALREADKKVQAALAQAENARQAQDRKTPMRKAIEQICNEQQLEMMPTRKFADSIRPELLKKMDVKSTTRGYSSKTIGGVIRAVLQERRESSGHS